MVFGVAGGSASGRLLVLADHSVFINDMMLQTDNDNIPFAFNVARWLTDDGKRPDVLFYDDGQIQTSFEVSLEYPNVPIPPLEAFVPLANQAIAELERNNTFNDLLLKMTGGPAPLLRTLAFLLTLALLFVGLYRFLHARYRPEAKVPRLPATLAAATSAGLTAVERRHRAVIAQGNLAEAARELAHQAFASIGVTPSPDGPPPVAVSGSWWQRLRGQRRVRELWALAVRGPRKRVSPAALERLTRAANDLHAAVAAGSVRLAAADSAI
jgi:hypothetical protein